MGALPTQTQPLHRLENKAGDCWSQEQIWQQPAKANTANYSTSPLLKDLKNKSADYCISKFYLSLIGIVKKKLGEDNMGLSPFYTGYFILRCTAWYLAAKQALLGRCVVLLSFYKTKSPVHNRIYALWATCCNFIMQFFAFNLRTKVTWADWKSWIRSRGRRVTY